MGYLAVYRTREVVHTWNLDLAWRGGVVIDGLDEATVEEATRVVAACRPGVLRITAGNYGGKLGPFHFHLHKLLSDNLIAQA